MDVECIASHKRLGAETTFVHKIAAEVNGFKVVAHFTRQPRLKHAQRASVVLGFGVFHNELLEIIQVLQTWSSI